MQSPRWIFLLFVVGCGDNGAKPDAPVPDSEAACVPIDGEALATLACTGLCVDRACTQISPDVREYTPRFPFWDDSATKRRWLYLPPGTKIDTTDMASWVFPVGTKVWKEFSRDGIRIETRIILKRSNDDFEPGAWFFATYKWTGPDQTEMLTQGEMNASGTQHDIPTRSNCISCHERLLPARILGVDAIQLDYAAPQGQLDLDDLVAAQALTTNPPGGASPHFPLPPSAIDRDALGYFHGNCGHCHNPSSDVHDLSPLDLRIRPGMTTPMTATPTYLTSVNRPASIPFTENGTTYSTLIIPDNPAMSAVIQRMNSTLTNRFMPNVAVEDIDPAGQAALTAWINSL